MKLRMILGFVVLAATTLAAQTFRGTILGTVSDATGAVVSSAKVTVRNTATGLERATETSADGSYSIAELPIGTYNVIISQAGFQTFVANGVTVDVATERRVDATLKPGEVSTRVEVSADELPLVETTTNDLGGVLTSQSVENLAINGRDYTKLIFLNPGVAGSPDQITDSPGSYGEFSMNGARGRSNNYLLDGTDMNDGYRNDPAINQGGVFAVPSAILPIDSIAEMHVLSNFEPEYGRNAGAVVNIVTKSGTNKLHGDLFEYFRNDSLAARNYFNINSQGRAPFHNNQFGGSLGGPITKDKTFFYVDYEGQRETVGTVTTACVPEGTGPGGGLSPNDASNPVIKALLANHNPWPAPNVPGVQSTGDGCPNGPNSTLITPSYNNLSSLITKIDHNFNTSNIVTGRYFFGDSTQSFPLALTASGGQLPGFNTVTPTRVQLVSLSYVHTVGSNKVNEVRYGWNRFAEGFFPQDQSFHPSSVGLCAASATADCQGGGPHDSGLPIMLVSVTPSGASGFFAQPGTTSGDPRHRVDSNNQFIDNFSWKFGKHDAKFGFEFRRTSIQQYLNKYYRGRMRFKGTTVGTTHVPALVNFLAGNLADGLQYSGNSTRHTSENGLGLYAQDSLRLTPRLTVNYGLRWDYYGVVKEKNNLFANFLVSSPTVGTLTQVGTNGLSRLYEPDYKNFSPRVSIAWDATGKGKTVIRAGWGLFFDAFSQDTFLGHLPYPTYYAPGPAYGNFGPAPILGASAPGQTLAVGQPIYTSTSTPNSNSCSPECDIFAVDRHIKTPYMENYNLNMQQQITNKMVLQVGYVGSQGHKLFRFYDINQPTQAAITSAALACACAVDFSSSVRPFNSPSGAFYILQEKSTGKSNYNSLQSSLRVTGWHGVTSTVNYVWSRSLDNSSDSEDFMVNAAQPQDSNNPQLEYGLSSFHLTNRFTWVFGYEIPKMGGGLQKLKNGWGFDSTVSLQSGQPFTLNFNCEDDFSGGGDCYDRPDVVGPIVYHKHDPNNFLDMTSFAIPCTVNVTSPGGAAADCVPGTQHFGNLGRNSLIGPTYKQWDLAIYKDTALGERVSLQLRAEIFNLVNHPNFASPLLPGYIADPAANLNTACGCGFDNTIRNGREVGNGQLLLGATGDVGIGNPFLGGGGPRSIQLAAKITF